MSFDPEALDGAERGMRTVECPFHRLRRKLGESRMVQRVGIVNVVALKYLRDLIDRRLARLRQAEVNEGRKSTGHA